MRLAKTLSRPLVLAAALAGLLPTAHAECQLRIAGQFGVVYVLLNVEQDQKLVGKHGKAAGIDIKVDYVKLSGGASMNDAVLSGSMDIVAAGVGPLLTTWDRPLEAERWCSSTSRGRRPSGSRRTQRRAQTPAGDPRQDRAATCS